MAAIIGEASSGAVGAMISLAFCYPLHQIKIRLQAQKRGGTDPMTFRQCLQGILRTEGLAGLYVGLRPALVKASITNFVFYFWFSVLKGLYRSPGGATSTWRNVLHGMNAGALVQLVVLPVDMCVNRIVASKGKKGFREVAKEIYDNGGIFGFWSGIIPGLCLCINPGITTAVRSYLSYGQNFGARGNFGAGALSKAIAGTCTYSYVVAKIQMQIQKRAQTAPSAADPAANAVATASGGKRYAHFVECIVDIFKTEGLLGLYNGIGPHLTAGVLKEALLNMIRHWIKAGITGVVFGLANLPTYLGNLLQKRVQ